MIVRKRLAVAALLVLLVSACHVQAPAQTDTSAVLYKLSMVDGSELIGTIISASRDTVMFKTGAGIVMAVPRFSIKTLAPAAGEYVRGEYRRYDPNVSRLLIGPTGRPLKAGQGYFAAYEIFFTYFGVGVTDNFSLGGGITLFPAAPDQLFFLAPKVGFSNADETMGFSVGGIYMNTTSGGAEVGVLYGMGTFGSPAAAFTAGLGYGYAEEEFSESPLLVLGGEVQLSNSVKLLSENYVGFGSDIVILSFGIRFFGDRLSADLGFFYPMVEGEGISEGFPFLPWLGFAYNFGN